MLQKKNTVFVSRNLETELLLNLFLWFIPVKSSDLEEDRKLIRKINFSLLWLIFGVGIIILLYKSM